MVVRRSPRLLGRRTRRRPRTTSGPLVTRCLHSSCEQVFFSMELTNKVVLLTGAKRIGAVVAGHVAKRGADVVLAYNRSQGEAEEAAGTVRDAGRRALVLQANVSDEAACASLVAAIDREFGRL